MLKTPGIKKHYITTLFVSTEMFDDVKIMDHSNHTGTPPSVTGLQLPRRPLRRPHASLTRSNNMLDPESPHILVGTGDSLCTTSSSSDMSHPSRCDSPMDIYMSQALTPPELRSMGSFEEFRMPAFSMSSLHETTCDDELRQVPSWGAPTKTIKPNQRRHKRTTLSLGGPGEDFQALAAASHVKGPQRRSRNKALVSSQFDQILSEVFDG